MERYTLLAALCFVAVFSYGQDKIVLNTDTIDCQITGIEMRGVVFQFDGGTRVAGLDMVSAVNYEGRWMQNGAIRKRAAAGVVFAESSPVEPIVKAEKYNTATAAYFFDRAGTTLQASGLIIIVSYIVAGILANSNLTAAYIVAGVGSGLSLAGLISAGSNLREAAALGW